MVYQPSSESRTVITALGRAFIRAIVAFKVERGYSKSLVVQRLCKKFQRSESNIGSIINEGKEKRIKKMDALLLEKEGWIGEAIGGAWKAFKTESGRDGDIWKMLVRMIVLICTHYLIVF